MVFFSSSTRPSTIPRLPPELLLHILKVGFPCPDQDKLVWLWLSLRRVSRAFTSFVTSHVARHYLPRSRLVFRVQIRLVEAPSPESIRNRNVEPEQEDVYFSFRGLGEREEGEEVARYGIDWEMSKLSDWDYRYARRQEVNWAHAQRRLLRALREGLRHWGPGKERGAMRHVVCAERFVNDAELVGLELAAGGDELEVRIDWPGTFTRLLVKERLSEGKRQRWVGATYSLLPFHFSVSSACTFSQTSPDTV